MSLEPTRGAGRIGDGELLMPVVEQRCVDDTETLGRNEPCWCGSGKKFKKCHGATSA
jgi:preprotein translocase subunit SecA